MLGRLRCDAGKCAVLHSLQVAPLQNSVRLVLQEVDGNNERLETRVLGLSVVEAVVDLLGDHGKPEKPETQVEIKVVNPDAYLLCVPGRFVGSVPAAWKSGGSSLCTQYPREQPRSMRGSPIVAISQSSTPTIFKR